MNQHIERAAFLLLAAGAGWWGGQQAVQDPQRIINCSILQADRIVAEEYTLVDNKQLQGEFHVHGMWTTATTPRAGRFSFLTLYDGDSDKRRSIGMQISQAGGIFSLDNELVAVGKSP